MEDPARSDPDRGGNVIRLVAADPVPEPIDDGLVDSYRRLSDVYHDLLSEQSLDALLDRIADALAELIPYEALHVYEADESRRELVPRLVRSEWADEILSERFPYGEGITGWAVEQREAVLANQAHLHPLVRFVPGTPVEPEALIVIPMIARGLLKGTFNIYRIGEDASFGEQEFELAKRFGDAAALALDNAHIRERLEHQAQTDSLTGLFNHRYFHERLRHELTRASGAHESVAVLMADIDDFKKVNDVYGHAVGDLVLAELSDHLRATVRSTDVVCRIGGEEFAVIVPASEEAHAIALASRLSQRLDEVALDVAGRVSVSIGIAHGPEHAANPRELVACAEAAMMTAKARGKSQVVLFGEHACERPGEPELRRDDIRSIAHLKLLQSLVGKLNRLNDVREIGMAIANELRLLIDYHNCRIFLREGEDLVPIAFQGDLTGSDGAAFDVLATKVGDGFTGWVAEQGESLLLPDAARCELAVAIEGTDTIEESVIAVPLNLGSRVLGVIVVSKLGIGQLDDDDMRLLEVLAGHAAVALENARLYEAQRREAQSAHALLGFSRDLAAAEGLESVYARVVDGSARLLGAPHASLWLQELETGDLVCCATTGYVDEEHVAARRFPAGAIAPFAARIEPYLLSPAEYAAFAPPPAGGSGHFAIAPFSFDGRWGTIAVGSAEDTRYEQRELELLGGLAHQAKLALANATSFESLERTFLSTVEALANALEARDHYTSSHARWITDTALRVGEELGLDGETLKRLELGALFHDIGKIGIPNSVLLKPGPLTDDERALIETHPDLGARILAPIDQLEDVCSIVRACHERWDGRGYPDRKAGDAIPLEARIIFACDAFHAMTTDRPYRAKLDVEEALRRLEEAAGTQFDPRVVEVCVRLLEAPPPS
ncbi:MAG: diguanylate cyclase [Gaiellaceae bacterium MAG52_C11]|nr:diguanylate cyclase [Candidatus Gaiellasilicea maunaloa]